jgi:hypothetical protein
MKADPSGLIEDLIEGEEEASPEEQALLKEAIEAASKPKKKRSKPPKDLKQYHPKFHKFLKG